MDIMFNPVSLPFLFFFFHRYRDVINQNMIPIVIIVGSALTFTHDMYHQISADQVETVGEQQVMIAAITNICTNTAI